MKFEMKGKSSKEGRESEKLKYPACIGKKLFDDCPEKVDDVNNPPAVCKSCPQFTPTAEMIRERMRKTMEKSKV